MIVVLEVGKAMLEIEGISEAMLVLAAIAALKAAR
jgi:hypothetical protein